MSSQGTIPVYFHIFDNQISRAIINHPDCYSDQASESDCPYNENVSLNCISLDLFHHPCFLLPSFAVSISLCSEISRDGGQGSEDGHLKATLNGNVS